MTTGRRLLLAAVLALLAAPVPAAAQFGAFGTNRIQYRRFDWQILRGAHVDLYHYPEEVELARVALSYAEDAYRGLAVSFRHEVPHRIPLIIYASHADFEQTNLLHSCRPRACSSSPSSRADASRCRSAGTTPSSGTLSATPPSRLANAPGLANTRLVMFPGAKYSDPELSWKFESGPAGTAFVQGAALGAHNQGTLWIGSSRAFQQVGGTGGSLYRLRLSRERKKVDVSDPQLAERVVDNLGKFEGTESESLLIGTGFGTTPSIEQGPDGNLYVVSITDGAIYRISRR